MGPPLGPPPGPPPPPVSLIPAGATVDNTWGAAFLGLLVAAILYGITSLQVYVYFTNYPNDPRRFKALTVIVWILDSASLALVVNAMYGYLITDMLDPFARFRVNRSLNLDPAIMGILAFLTHGYLGTRVYIVCNRSKIIAGMLALMACSSLTLAITSTVVSFRFEFWAERAEMRPLALAGTALCVILDGLIATILCVYLLKQRAIGKRVRRLVKRIIIFAINTGLASSILSIVNVVTFIALPNTMIFLGTNFIFTKVYANCLLANLNARDSLRGRGFVDDGTLSLNLSALRGGTMINMIAFNEPASPGADDTAVNIPKLYQSGSHKDSQPPDSPA
jgi:hypothetical protein